MKLYLNIAIISILSFCYIQEASAQTTMKEMDKKTKAELKEYIKNPSSYRKMIKNYKEQIDAYDVELNEVKEDYYKADYLRTLYYDSIMELQAKMQNMQTAPANVETSTEKSMYASSGTEYRVQIGAYRYFDFTQLLKFNQPIGYENVNGVIHYFLGSWKDADEAYEFAQNIRKLKIKDAFVTKYVNGSRIPYDHLIEGSATTAYSQP
ncbi:MAG: hypothetical protein H6579_03950 [Chitinophagales bacterium]|nr:hypothetical protein [Bacteroidota bacterium]MCB9256263.1 hypothetical protein [Chitinophagales bacterium]